LNLEFFSPFFQRVSASDENAEALAWRAVTILDTIYNSVNPTDPGHVPPQLLRNIEQFERYDGVRCSVDQ
jgi:hypothetical protein